jgi:hypothetical protein
MGTGIKKARRTKTASPALDIGDLVAFTAKLRRAE